ncbi:hypothetical protein L226DRAFT_566086 [Lentinus tigrinus ALCF2SS1-7]|uniref:Uncharacterized protein n=1 Tax=Lentinus tigrinus ALCF2SS1-6 TaxID=1328759 RepID=A0A5C2SUQ0_9APHY|nr:hypothetical protein L227DRAFT_605749 [Lentinus tigrinus ALCF2SS1-6]RPD81301.1 hypothetical protein L226DRAFT_566086 [Lentinus tigrinus ALCF2SS1-7]
MRLSVILNLQERVSFWASPTKHCYIDRLPVEVLESIAVLACTDNGSTGCSLSRVSKDMRAATRAGRFTSVAISSRTPEQLASFLACFIAERGRVAGGYSTPRVRHLFLASAKRTSKNDDPKAHPAELKSYQESVSSLMDLVAADLYSLLVFHEGGFYYDFPLPDIGLLGYPLLEQLALFGSPLGFPPVPPGREVDGMLTESTDDNPVPPSLPRLTHLQLTRTTGFGLGMRVNQWAREAPGITHVFLCNIDYHDRFPSVRSGLRNILNLNGPNLWNDLQVLIVQPTSAPGFLSSTATNRKAYQCFMESLEDLHETAVRGWALLPVMKRSTGRKEFEKAARKEWLAWQRGGPGCWSVHKSYYSP